MNSSIDEVKYNWIVSRAEKEALAPLALEIIQAFPEIKVLKAPEPGLLMLRVKESVENKPFNLGELLVTDCTVTLEDDKLGWGCCLGEDENRALYLAVLNLAWYYLPEWQQQIEAVLEKEEERIVQEESMLYACVDTTRVNFEVR